jgi:hypothetical protein
MAAKAGKERRTESRGSGGATMPSQCLIDWSGLACRQSRASPTVGGVA